ncbi:hypothetical protein TVAG_439160 [Trichomonas vaginalis G3]|uniref:Uncharacterized protein n=1 Tax=Trichomonas vaginalis (strain ATCC PRA-98 / G3) TaxID=412133 RepID=A2FQY3_TRIV3|nr:metallo-hydrolase/oxidoreductase family [Trichomonas vaginalis G3]EAX92688.1 hypothetical protein TVAG_439160 [Trichomonas vaginalis G3]KAI5553001.1 metallo-hydrolase/oxidoreductase family [Trichomonas vaginalis G3]|eukprot:XP_001305618.1 hypothetical protein [Trichomonas vaginalis G3]
MFRVDCKNNGTIIECLGVKILALFEQFPTSEHLLPNFFTSQFNFDYSTIDIVLISDGRSYVLVEALMKIPEFHGLIVTTQANYRIGRNLITEYRMIDSNNRNPLPTDLRIITLNFHQPFTFTELCFIPTPNGCGIGNCNWLITKNTDAELVSFKAFLVTGYNTSTTFTPPYSPIVSNSQATPLPPPPKAPDVVCVVPTAISEFDCGETIKIIASKVKEKLGYGLKVVIPTFTDDILFFLMSYLRYTSALSVGFAHLSYRGQTLMDIATSFEYTEAINGLEISEKVDSNILEGSSVLFGPSPNQPIGQIVQARDFLGNRCDFMQIISPEPKPYIYAMNSGYQALSRYINQMMSENVIIPPIFQRLDSFSIKNAKPYPFETPISEDLVRWVDIKELQLADSRFPVFSGNIVGEYAKVASTSQNFVVSPPILEQIVYYLTDQGAQNIDFSDNRLTFEFPFVEGDSKASILFTNDDITLETGSGLIEDVILEFLTKKVHSYV